MAGLFMFLAVSFAGVWLARSNQRRNHKAIAAALLVAVVLGIGTVIVRANAGPPGYVRWQNLPQSLKDGKETVGGTTMMLTGGNAREIAARDLTMPSYQKRRDRAWLRKAKALERSLRKKV